uniref:DUF4258 domain-containing protein n=1 Tax=Caenorhabditis tropicalis TaxID=1561998 RepID=A0A1I7TKQ4_9PELO
MNTIELTEQHEMHLFRAYYDPFFENNFSLNIFEKKALRSKKYYSVFDNCSHQRATEVTLIISMKKKKMIHYIYDKDR